MLNFCFSSPGWLASPLWCVWHDVPIQKSPDQARHKPHQPASGRFSQDQHLFGVVFGVARERHARTWRRVRRKRQNFGHFRIWRTLSSAVCRYEPWLAWGRSRRGRICLWQSRSARRSDGRSTNWHWRLRCCSGLNWCTNNWRKIGASVRHLSSAFEEQELVHHAHETACWTSQL